MHVIFSLVDHGNMIERFNMMVGRIHIVSCLVAQKFLLLPYKEIEPKPTLGGGKNLLVKRAFVEEMFDSGLVFVLLGKESSKGSVVPEAVQSLLDEFANVFPKDLSDGLPPL